MRTTARALVLGAAALVVGTVVASAQQEGGTAPAPAPAAPPPERECKIDVLAKGDGREAKSGDIVLVQLSVKLADSGRTIMDTHLEGSPQMLRVGSGYTVPAIDLTVEKMRQGDHWKVEAPFELAWGPGGYGRLIPARSDVVLDIELVGFLEIRTEVLKEGSGPTPVPGEYVLMHYTASLEDGKEFDDSRKSDTPVLVVMGGGKLIQGWEETLRKMRVGDRVKATIPWQLAYGADGRSPDIPPKTGVVLDIERLPLPEVKVEVLKEGKGPAVVAGREIKVHYDAMYPDGRKFDSSRDRGVPRGLVLGAHNAIPGWELTMVKMHVGDRWKITVPWSLAYDPERPGSIPEKTDLVYDIEILSMN